MRNLNIVLTIDDEMASWLDAALEKHKIQIADAIKESLILWKDRQEQYEKGKNSE